MRKIYFFPIIIILAFIGCESSYDVPHEGGQGTRFAPFVRWDDEVENINFVMDLTATDNPVFSAPIIAPGDNVVSYDLEFSLASTEGVLGPWSLPSITSLPAMISFSADDLKQASGLSDEAFGGQLQFVATVTGDDGLVYRGTDQLSGDALNPGQRQAHTFNINLVCPSDLAGEYAYTVTGMSTDGCCPESTTLEGTLQLTETTTTGSYTISDISAGLYLEWYDVYGITEAVVASTLTATVSDACGIFSGSTGGPFGGTPTVSGTVVDRENGIIEYRWDNGFGDFGEVRLERVQ